MDRTVAEEAHHALAEAHQAQERGDREQAIVLLDQGIARLGYEYLKGHLPVLKDDTGLSLIKSDFARADGRLDVAITLRSRALETRLKLYAQGHCPPAR